MRCGTRLEVVRTTAAAERRQITVLFCDMVGSTALSEELDPEDLRDVIRRYHATCEGVVARFDGSIAQHLGDGVLVYFGHPRAHEDDTVRAVRAALELRKAVSSLIVRGRPLSVRVGIHTGVVVVGAVGAEARQLALGATPNLAARIQQEALSGTVLISEASHRLVSGFFQESDLGMHSIRGVTQPIHLYRVEGETGARSRMEATAAAALTPFIGREKESALVLRLWADALEGKAPVLRLSGEPGIGKSRLVRSLREAVGPEAVVIECYASPLFQDTALHPIVEMLERQIGTANKSPESRRARLHEQLRQSNLATRATMVPLEVLLSIPPSDEAETTNQATFDALSSWLRALTERQPVLVVLEDLHWADPSTIELVNLLIDRLSTERLMMLLTHRSDFEPPLSSSRMTQLTLQRMPPEEARKILAAVMTDKQLPEAVEREVLTKADGVPLYVEEIGKAVMESRPRSPGGPSGPASSREEFEIPATVVDSLTARLDRLGDGKKVVQLAATLGRTFALAVLLDVAGMQESALRSELERLQSAGLVLRQDDVPEESYIFKHALIQDAAYGSLLRVTRQDYHRQIARVLEGKFPNVATSQPELLARHFDGAGMMPEAISYWALAGQKAIGRSANAEAISAFGNALQLLSSLPASEKRDRQEIELRCGLGLALISAQGWSAKEVENAYGPAHELCRQYGDLPLRVLYGICAVYMVRADRERVGQLNAMLEHVVQSSTDRQDLVIAHGLLGGSAFWGADFSTARHHCNAGASHVDRENPRKQALDLFSLGYDGPLYSIVFKAWTDIVQARACDAAAASKEAIDIAFGSGNPFLMALALSYGGAVAHDMRDIELVEARGHQLSDLAANNSFPFFSANALSFLGWVALKRDQHERGIEMMRQAVGFYHAVGANCILPYYLSYVAEGCIDTRRVEEGLDAVDDALRITETKHAVFCEPELHRLKGELLLLKGERDKAETHLSAARALAGSAGAVLFEARACLSLGRLRGAQGRGAEAVPHLVAAIAAIAPEEPLIERRELVDLERRLSRGHA
jgi:class 3 adenylate cyclase/tetratricopeptide (TPR) repeat protein